MSEDFQGTIVNQAAATPLTSSPSLLPTTRSLSAERQRAAEQVSVYAGVHGRIASCLREWKYKLRTSAHLVKLSHEGW